MALRETQIAATLIYSSVTAHIEIGDELVVVGDRVVAVRSPTSEDATRAEAETTTKSLPPVGATPTVWDMVQALDSMLRRNTNPMTCQRMGDMMGFDKKDVARRAVVAAAVKYMVTHGMLVRHTQTRKPQYLLVANHSY